MKYKNLKSVAHNFSHSFVSFMNYVDGAYVIDDLRQLARKAGGERVSIYWLPISKEQADLTPRVLKGIADYKTRLPKFFSDAGADLEAISEFRTDVFLLKNKQIAVEAYLLDDRGKKYISNVMF